MRPLTTPELFEVWERGLQYSQIDKSLSLLSVASSKTDADPATLSIGQRDLRLLQLREWMFGQKLLNTAICPDCGQKVEWENEVKDFKLQSIEEKSSVQKFEFYKDEYSMVFRLPVSNDMLHLNAYNSAEENKYILLNQCLLEIKKNNQPCLAGNIPQYILNGLEEYMGSQDAQADISIILKCPDCSKEWKSNFDIQHYLWIEINAWAKNLLQEIYVLAKHFGWPEKDILSMSPQRRQLYLQMIFS